MEGTPSTVDDEDAGEAAALAAPLVAVGAMFRRTTYEEGRVALEWLLTRDDGAGVGVRFHPASGTAVLRGYGRHGRHLRHEFRVPAAAAVAAVLLMADLDVPDGSWDALSAVPELTGWLVDHPGTPDHVRAAAALAHR